MSRKIYAVKKYRGKWAVCSDDNVVLQFETYAEAIEIAQSAVEVSANRTETPQDELKPTFPTR
ncbi:MAG: hypothetical protein WCG92_06670 [Hyphomicrobiales bacterium]